ncbi:uncharacterized protein BX663DRAFT_502332 [Cokeromyces recurvatus]|uniref:uncharacterized protein n=1 Tax=Cokeromyces recurvatus TaxID=90255 RepID=UPI00221FAC04|nr:uncharacterized protein BX663DRAFT_502332 [Cokeromyces recurvatus]KAI7905281.1 hypothetical protein BX663DRAFT_502332 [Cokeromyces recurvatus]
MYLFWVLVVLIYEVIAYEQHCIDPANCQFYPVHGCYATDIGLVCKNRNKGGFEMSIDPIYTFIYTPHSIKNDTGLPCHTIPITDELINYVDYRGPQVIDVQDLELIGNCSSMSYCDKKTRTCQPKLPLGSFCQYNMQCYFGIDGIPGHCTNHTCSIRQDIPQYYYNTPRWTMGDQWQAAVIAVLVTGGMVIVLLIGRAQLKKLVGQIKVIIEKWQNSAFTQQENNIPFVANEQVWNEHHDQRWWKQVPGMNWVYSKLKRGGGSEDYYQLDNREEEEEIITEEPPPYQEN